MPLIDFASAVKPELLYQSAGYTVSTNGPSLTYGFDSRGSYAAIIVVNCGTFRSGATLHLYVYESDDAATWTLIPDSAFPVIAQSPTGDQVPANDLYFARVNFVQKKRYISLKSEIKTQRAEFSASAFLLSYDTRNNVTPGVAV